MKNIISVSFDIPLHKDEIDYVDFHNTCSLSDYDIALFYPTYSEADYSVDFPNSEYNGKTLYNHSSSTAIQESSSHWKNEIKDLINNGKNVYVILCAKEDFFVHTGERQYSGTGRNRQITNIVNPYNNYCFLPNITAIANSSGKVIVPTNPLVKQFYELFKKFMNYECFIKSVGGNTADLMPTSVLFTTKNKDKVLGFIDQEKKGSIIFLPNIEFKGEDIVVYDEDDDELSWTDKAFTVGKAFIDHVISLDKAIGGTHAKTPTPQWLKNNSYKLKGADKTKNIIISREHKIESLKIEIDSLQKTLEEQENLLGLLYETGKPLEMAVKQGLELLGFTAENYDDGALELDHIIISPEGYRYVGECEGKDNKDIDISKFRQLHDSLNEDFEREEVREKAFGLLFGNAQRLINPSDRNLDFTLKCKKGAERERIGLIKTTDLFFVARYLLENQDEAFKKLCRDEIHNQLGSIIALPPVPKAR